MSSTAQARLGARTAAASRRRERSAPAARAAALDQLGALALAVVFVSIALVARLGFGPVLGERPYLLFAAAVLGSAWLGGAAAGVPAVAIAVAALSYLFVPPPGFGIGDPRDLSAIVLFVLQGVFVTALCEQLRDQRARAERAAHTAAREAAERRQAELTGRRMESGLTALNRLATALGADLQGREVGLVAAQVAASVTGAAAAALTFQGHGEQAERLCELAGSPELARRLDLDLSELQASLRGQKVLRFDDVRHDGALARLSGGAHPLRSVLVARLDARSGRGMLLLGHPSVGQFDGGHEQLLGILAAQAASALDNAHHRADAQQALAAAQVAGRVKDEFLSTLSHELRTPLNAIIGWAHLLQGRRLGPEDTHRAIETIVRNASLQESMIGELLDMSSLLNGRLRLDTAPLDLRRVVDEAVATARGYARAKSVDLQLTNAAHEVRVTGDANRLQQAVWSLLSNAVKFTPAGGSVRVEVATRGDKAEVVVGDTGAGMERELLGRLFSRFSLADASSTRRTRGLGLGLSVARGLVELHDGQITAESPGPGLGSTFTVRLPLAQAASVTGTPAAHECHGTGPLPDEGAGTAREGVA